MYVYIFSINILLSICYVICLVADVSIDLLEPQNLLNQRYVITHLDPQTCDNVAKPERSGSTSTRNSINIQMC